jgi:hypothetical protein
MWDKADRRRDDARLDRGEGVLSAGHLTPASTVQDAEADEILAMPASSIWPPLCALALFGIFVMLLMAHYWIAVGFLAAVGLTILGWHSHGGQQ